MQTTANYALKKPDGTDVVDIQNFNDNADVIDTELKKRALQTDFSSHLADSTAHGIGDKTKLNTTAKDTIVAAINEVFQSGTSVKSSTISAVNSKGQSLSTTATWDQIIASINSIARGQGNAVESQVLSGVDFSNSDGILRHGSMPNNGTVVLTPTTVNQAIVQGYHPGTGYVKGDANLVTANIKSGVSIFGVSGKSSVVETTESANPIVASTVRSGKVGYVNGSKITGSLAVQATAAQTITPGTSNIMKGAGIYDGAITIKGDSNLQSLNILKGKSIFGVTGTAEEKIDFSDYLLNNTFNIANTPIFSLLGYIKGEGIYGQNYNYEGKCFLYNASGVLIKTITSSGSGLPYYVSENHIVWATSGYLSITDKAGTLIKQIYNSDINIVGACMNDKTEKLYAIGENSKLCIWDLNGTLLQQIMVNNLSNELCCMLMTPIKNGVFVVFTYYNEANISALYITDTGTVVNLHSPSSFRLNLQLLTNILKIN